MAVRGRQIWELPWYAVDGLDAYVDDSRRRELVLYWGSDPSEPPTLRITFHRASGYRVLCRDAGGLADEVVGELAWAHLAEIYESSWLDPDRLYTADVPESERRLRHFAVLLFDGPCFEFLAEGFSIEEDGHPVIVPDPDSDESGGAEPSEPSTAT